MPRTNKTDGDVERIETLVSMRHDAAALEHHSLAGPWKERVPAWPVDINLLGPYHPRERQGMHPHKNMGTGAPSSIVQHSQEQPNSP